ncbi:MULTISPECIES: FliI/YscN family ATPase [Buttiauxella]|jgi:flagellum-specific ATP synthase|nr:MULTISPECIES: FliI/YscN family ATPase [Buttiauxella]TDN49784.1 flagellum-specific ATP synthase [Buttiauxella sp. JUb87]
MRSLNSLLNRLELDEYRVPPAQIYGKLVRVTGLLLEVTGCPLSIGQRALVEVGKESWLETEVVGFNQDRTFLMPLEQVTGLFPGARVSPQEGDSELVVGPALLGRILDGLGRPLDGLGPLEGERISLHQPPLNPLERQPIKTPLDVGVKAINGILPLGRGQRIGLFAGSGVGKSVLLSMMTRFTDADVVVVGLIGERGREVAEFLQHTLGEEGRRKAVVVVAPADVSPLLRLRASQVCHRIAESFRDRGKHVLLLMDSLTRYAIAQREIALSLGEPPATKGYPPSVFTQLPQLVERAGNGYNSEGSLSAIYTVLVEGDDHNDPIADAARAILDGHIVLRRDIAEQGIYPAIDVSASASRVIPLICSAAQIRQIQQFRRYYSLYQQVRELIPLGGYQAGHDEEMDKAVTLFPQMLEYLQQSSRQGANLQQTQALLQELMEAGNK